MKKLLTLLLAAAFALLAVAAEKAEPRPIVTTVTKPSGVKVRSVTNYVQGAFGADGSLTLDAIQTEVVIDGDGAVLSERVNASVLKVPVSAATLTALKADIAAAQAARR